MEKTGAPRDTEITLGTGKLLGIFFVMVIICAAFFTMGYLLGRGSTPIAASTTIVSSVPTNGGNPANKPSAGGSKAGDPTQNCPAGSNCTPSSSPDSSIYNSVSSKSPVATQSNPTPTVTVPAKGTDASTPSAPSPADAKNASTGSYMVQVAAVSKQEDADILVNALRKKQYPVFVANLPSDPLFHVQVGPFSDPKEAEAMRSRLAGDGYNAIVKK